MEDSRYLIGIDLGTTNSVLYYVDTEAERPRIRHFPVPQLVAPGEVDTQPVLPSFCYLPPANDLPAGALALPWDAEITLTVGTFARDHGARVPSRLIASAKSWLAHAGVDRQHRILPWGGDAGEAAKSPVEVTALYLQHLRQAWDQRFAAQLDQHGSPCRFDTQQVTITVPASFDENARELTLAAARQAGYGQVWLLEEPLAAFYAWLNRVGPRWPQQLAPDEHVLIVDVGGGTTDFSIVAVDDTGMLHRFAVGEHLLLGGDNIDMALARHIEQQWGTRLGAADWAALCQLSREAKEALLAGDASERELTLMSRGSSVVGHARTATVRRDQLLTMLNDGFYPRIPVDAQPPRRGGGMREMGLPYAAEPAVTRHLLQFLKVAARLAPGAPAGDLPPLYPDKVLFNGGSMIPDLVRQQILAALRDWSPERPPPAELRGEDFSRAVAVGAAYYGLVRRGRGIKVRGGLARSYFVEAAGDDGAPQLICVMSRDTDENTPTRTPRRFRLRANEPVRFAVYSSATRLGDQPGDVIAEPDELSHLAPLVSVLQFGRGGSRQVAAELWSTLTEIGTLDIELRSLETEHRWPLRFDLRAAPDSSGETPTVLVPAGRLEAASDLISKRFAGPAAGLPRLVRDLEELLELGREEWALPVLRHLADTLLAVPDCRQVAAAHETRWLNLTGFCLRPGFGDPGDRLRLRQCWRLWFGGPQHPRQPQAVAEWWILWRRIAPGLASGHQATVGNALMKVLMPQGSYRRRLREGEQAKVEMWRCLGALEHLSVKTKRRIGGVLLEHGGQRHASEYWALARLGARRLFHAPANLVLPAATAAEWLRALLDEGAGTRAALFAVARIARPVGDRKLDLPETVIRDVRSFMERHPRGAEWLEQLDDTAADSREQQREVLGDSLPLGLHLAE